MNVRVRVAAGSFAAGCLALFVLAGIVSSSPVNVPMLTGPELQVLAIGDAVDVTTTPDTALPAVAVSRTQAISVAAVEVGQPGAQVRVLRGSTPPLPGQPNRPAWIILFDGAVAPFDGPPGAPTPSFRVTGVIVDAQSGDFLSGFMK